eukprot:1370220-Rhodomonas_salina.1
MRSAGSVILALFLCLLSCNRCHAFDRRVRIAMLSPKNGEAVSAPFHLRVGIHVVGSDIEAPVLVEVLAYTGTRCGEGEEELLLVVLSCSCYAVAVERPATDEGHELEKGAYAVCVYLSDNAGRFLHSSSARIVVAVNESSTEIENGGGSEDRDKCEVGEDLGVRFRAEEEDEKRKRIETAGSSLLFSREFLRAMCDIGYAAPGAERRKRGARVWSWGEFEEMSSRSEGRAVQVSARSLCICCEIKDKKPLFQDKSYGHYGFLCLSYGVCALRFPVLTYCTVVPGGTGGRGRSFAMVLHMRYAVSGTDTVPCCYQALGVKEGVDVLHVRCRGTSLRAHYAMSGTDLR